MFFLANCRYFSYSEAENKIFRPAGATLCTDSRDIWHSREERGITSVIYPEFLSTPCTKNNALNRKMIDVLYHHAKDIEQRAPAADAKICLFCLLVRLRGRCDVRSKG